MKCFKCNNNVLPGSSTCPCCGSVVNKKIERERQKNIKPTAGNYKQRKEELLNNYNKNVNGISSNNSFSGGIFFIFIFIFICGVISFIIVEEESYYEDETFEQNVLLEDNEEEKIDSKTMLDNIQIIEEKVAKSGDVVFVLKNNNNFTISGSMVLDLLDKNGKSINKVSETFGMAASSTNIIVFKEYYLKDYVSYNKSMSVDTEKYLNYFSLDVNDITYVDSGEVIKAKYLNKNDTISSLKLCILYYKGKELVDTTCNYEFDVATNSYAEFSYSYGFDKKYNGLDFDNFKFYVSNARYKK